MPRDLTSPADPRPGLAPPPGGWDMEEIRREDEYLGPQRMMVLLIVMAPASLGLIAWGLLRLWGAA